MIQLTQSVQAVLIPITVQNVTVGTTLHLPHLAYLVQILRNAVSAAKLLANVYRAMMGIIYLLTVNNAQAALRSRHSVNFVVTPQAVIIAIADTI